jgi:Xaa-Pro aminopeptidase
MKSVEPGMFEYEIQALIEYVFRKEGAFGPGFESIVGSGKNATILHYESNSRQSQNGDLLLMDIGADFQHYTADVTRTIPINGKFTQEQKEIYEVVLTSQKAAIAHVKPGRGIREIHNKGVEVLKDGLFDLGLITDKSSDWQHRVWLMYNISHWLGLDVHDVGGRGSDDGVGRLLEPGMVLTVEPGVYINEKSLEDIGLKLGNRPPEENEIHDFVSAVKPVVKKYMDIGIRIEDDILVTVEGFENLSRQAPKEIEDIETLMINERKKGDDNV